MSPRQTCVTNDGNGATTRAPRGWRTRLLASLAVLGALAGCSGDKSFEGDAFTEFRPSSDLFPPAPASDAAIQTGDATPETDVFNCQPWRTEVEDDEATSPWTATRYDWIDGDAAKSWIVGVRTAAYDTNRYDMIDEIANDALDCAYGSGFYGDMSKGRIGSIAGLPDEAITFELRGETNERRARPVHIVGTTIVDGTSPAEVRADNEASADGNDTPTHVLAVYWIGWGTDVPPEQFADLVNSLVTATSHSSPDAGTGEDSSTAAEILPTRGLFEPSNRTTRDAASKEQNNAPAPA